MTYNIHPLFVHFPIAFLLLYSIIKILPFEKWIPQISWVDIKRVLLFVGVIGAFFALQTGEIAEHIIKPVHSLVEMHSLFATLSTWIYASLLLNEIIYMFKERILIKIKSILLDKFFTLYNNIFSHYLFSRVLSVAGLICITITGVLGGVMVFGLSADPIAPIVLSLLGIQI